MSRSIGPAEVVAPVGGSRPTLASWPGLGACARPRALRASTFALLRLDVDVDAGCARAISIIPDYHVHVGHAGCLGIRDPVQHQ